MLVGRIQQSSWQLQNLQHTYPITICAKSRRRYGMCHCSCLCHSCGWYHHLLHHEKLRFAKTRFTVDSQVRRSTKVIARSPPVERPRQGRHPRRRLRPPRPRGLAALGRLLVAMRSGLALQLELRVGLGALVSRIAVMKLRQTMPERKYAWSCCQLLIDDSRNLMASSDISCEEVTLRRCWSQQAHNLLTTFTEELC